MGLPGIVAKSVAVQEAADYTDLVAIGLTNVRTEGMTIYFTIAATGEEHSITLTDGGGKLTSSLKATVDIGSVTNGKTYASGTGLETILRDILIKEVAPGVTLTLDPETEIYDIVEETLDSVELKAVVTKGTNNPTSIKFYVGTTEINSQTITGPGTYTYTYTPATPINRDVTFKATASDGKLSASSTKNVKFVAHSYWGTIDDGVTVNETVIKALQNSTLKVSKALKYSGITMDYGKVVYTYPATLGTLTSIKDVKNNLNYTDSFNFTTIEVDGILHNVYTQIDSSASNDVEITFA